MTRFSIAFDKVLNTEGGYQDNPNDHGNYNSAGDLVGTKYGISAPVLEDWLGRLPTAGDMRSLPLSDAMTIYEQLYWDPNLIGNINDQQTANHVFDLFVNHGAQNAAAMVQDALISIGYNVTRDGKMGPQTVGAINQALNDNQKVPFNNELVKIRSNFYRAIVENDNTQSVFLEGWLRRAKQFVIGGTLTKLLMLVFFCL